MLTTKENGMTSRQIKSLRSYLGLTRQQLAGIVGVGQSLVSHWENGIRTPMGPAKILLQKLQENPSVFGISTKFKKSV